MHMKKQNYFTGKTYKLAFLNFMQFVISLVTLGFGYPFIEIIIQKYICMNTYINGKKLKFLGTIKSIFFLYSKWLFLTYITLGIFSFNLNFMLHKWKCNYTVFEDNLDNSSSKFNAYGFDNLYHKIISIFICVFTLGIGLPYALCRLKKWEKAQTYINGYRLEFTGQAKELFFKYVFYYLLIFLTLGIFSFFMPKYLYEYIANNQKIADNQNDIKYEPILKKLSKYSFFKKIIPKSLYEIKK